MEGIKLTSFEIMIGARSEVFERAFNGEFEEFAKVRSALSADAWQLPMQISR